MTPKKTARLRGSLCWEEGNGYRSLLQIMAESLNRSVVAVRARHASKSNSIHTGAWPLECSCARTDLSTPALMSRFSKDWLRRKWSIRSPASRVKAFRRYFQNVYMRSSGCRWRIASSSPAPQDRRRLFAPPAEQRVVDPALRRVDVEICRHDVEIADEHGRRFEMEKLLRIGLQPGKPIQLVLKLRTGCRIAVRQVETSDDHAIDHGLDVSALNVIGIAGNTASGFAGCFAAREDRDTVPGFLAMPDRAVAGACRWRCNSPHNWRLNIPHFFCGSGFQGLAPDSPSRSRSSRPLMPLTLYVAIFMRGHCLWLSPRSPGPGLEYALPCGACRLRYRSALACSCVFPSTVTSATTRNTHRKTHSESAAYSDSSCGQISAA